MLQCRKGWGLGSQITCSHSAGLGAGAGRAQMEGKLPVQNLALHLGGHVALGVRLRLSEPRLALLANGARVPASLCTDNE